MVSGTRPTVLLIDSYQDSRDMYREFLAINGFPTVATDNSDSGLRLAADADVIVTGIALRGSFGGLELLRRVRLQHSDKPVIVLTASAEAFYRQAAEQAGCDAFLTKPCVPSVLLAEIRRTLATSRSLSAKALDDARKQAADRVNRSTMLLKSLERLLTERVRKRE